jgi:hypothetical protein
MSKHAAATLSTQLHMLDASESGGASQSQNEQRRLLQLSRLCLLAADIIKPHNLWHLTRQLLVAAVGSDGYWQHKNGCGASSSGTSSAARR